MLASQPEMLARLLAKYPDLEQEWRKRYGYGFDALTESEARALLRERVGGELFGDGTAGEAAGGSPGGRPANTGAAGPGESGGGTEGGLSEPPPGLFGRIIGDESGALRLAPPAPPRTPAERAVLDRISIGATPTSGRGAGRGSTPQ